ncbi:MAG: metallophosphoesterase family protein [Lentisphaeria bacterium]|nr:metallophosphoesterase family protein [Lentisphaeria bacterium]
MLLFLSDLHCRYHLVNQQIRDAERRFETAIDATVLLGDMGLFEPFLNRYFRREGERFACPLHFIEGNHEDFDAFPRLLQLYGEYFRHLPRTSVTPLDGWPCLALGGVEYMDAYTTPEASLILPRHIDACLALPRDAARLILSHDCPAGIGVPSTPGFEHYGPPGIRGARALADHFRPRFWLFGHHHRWFDATVDGTRFVGLPQSWMGYAVLTREGDLSLVPNPLNPGEPPPFRWRGLLPRPNAGLLRTDRTPTDPLQGGPA